MELSPLRGRGGLATGPRGRSSKIRNGLKGNKELLNVALSFSTDR